MKKLLIIALVVIVVLTGLGLAAWHYAPIVAFRMLGKAISGSVVAAKSTVAYKDGALVFSLREVQMKGAVEGRVASCVAKLRLSRGIYIKHLALSDFDLAVEEGQGSFKFFPIPVERAEITKGVLKYGGRTYVIKEITVSNFNTGKKLEFTIDGGIEGLGSIKTHGEGIFGGEKRSEIEGGYSLSKVDMSRLLKDYEGFADSRGIFAFRHGTLTVDGDIEAPYFSIWEKFLSKRVGAADNKGHIHLTRAGEKIDLSITNLRFNDAPLTLRCTVRGKTLLSLELTLEYIGIPQLQEYVNLAEFSEGGWGPLSYVKDGEVRIERLTYRKGKPLDARIDVRHASAGNESVLFRDVDGSLRLDGESVVLSDFRGKFGTSEISSVSGVVPLKPDRDVSIKGRYAVAIEDIEKFYKIAELKPMSGAAVGAFELQGRKEEGFGVEGEGVLRDGRFVWRTISFDASGSYRFGNGFLALDEMSISGEETNLHLSGRVEKDSVSLVTKGVVDARHIDKASVIPSRYALEGSLGVEAEVEVRENLFSTQGSVDMTHLSFEIPGIMKKSSGILGAAEVSLNGRKGEVHVRDLKVTLGEMKAEGSGRVREGLVTNGRLALDVPDLERASRLFFFDEIQVGGELKADLQVENLSYPLKKLPAITGSLSFHHGLLHLPFLAESFRGVDLSCRFGGDSLEAVLSGLRTGNTVVRSARLTVAGVDAPSFSLSADIEHFDAHDFRRSVSRPFSLPSIDPESLIAKIAGEFLLTARTVRAGDVVGEAASIDGTFGNRVLSLRKGSMMMGPGSLDLTGTVFFAEKPDVRMTGELKNVAVRDVLAFAGGKTEVIEGRGSVSADLAFAGRDFTELSRSATGRVHVDSRNGVIKKWHLISRLLALSNIYDLLRGEVDLTHQGLSYKRLSATFEVTEGVFKTSNFLIDSPSMVITGQGAIDAPAKSIDGRMLVSPLVTIDKILDWIPLIRNIFRERKTGLLFFIYDVKGPIDDPEITSSYVQSVGRRIWNIFWNAIRLPKDVLDLLPKEEPPAE